MNCYRLHFIRHGLTQGNKKGLYIGVTDLPLCNEGIGEIEKLKENFEYPKASKVYTSPLKRCVSTAEILYPDRLIENVENLKECNFGIFEGKSIAEIKNTPEFLAWIEGEGKTAPPQGESGVELTNRVIEAIDYILRDMMKMKIYDAAVVTHGGVIMTLFAACGYPKASMNDWATDRGRGYTVNVDPRLWMTDNIFEITERIPY